MKMNFFFKDSLIENLPIPYSAVSADIKSFKEVVFNTWVVYITQSDVQFQYHLY